MFSLCMGLYNGENFRASLYGFEYCNYDINVMLRDWTWKKTSSDVKERETTDDGVVTINPITSRIQLG